MMAVMIIQNRDKPWNQPVQIKGNTGNTNFKNKSDKLSHNFCIQLFIQHDVVSISKPNIVFVVTFHFMHNQLQYQN